MDLAQKKLAVALKVYIVLGTPHARACSFGGEFQPGMEEYSDVNAELFQEAFDDGHSLGQYEVQLLKARFKRRVTRGRLDDVIDVIGNSEIKALRKNCQDSTPKIRPLVPVNECIYSGIEVLGASI